MMCSIHKKPRLVPAPALPVPAEDWIEDEIVPNNYFGFSSDDEEELDPAKLQKPLM